MDLMTLTMILMVIIAACLFILIIYAFDKILDKQKKTKTCNLCGTEFRTSGGNTICSDCAKNVKWNTKAGSSPANQVSCPKCGKTAYRGSFRAWQVLLSIFLFPIGLLTLLAGRDPSECTSCHYRW